ncbi:hypothetical protein EVAR_22968_1 [Eumeta japonica]|uniref:Uncharacterized protein n=1 Tax=Eumeta variegata TaxID=151549 RepID=A0A4C1UQ01_EUMVA|nr:hypothetical protein EVAR_22968_1 [Eumeta japonica]
MSMGGSDHLLFGGLYARLPLDLLQKVKKLLYFSNSPLGGIGCIGVTAHASSPSSPRNLVTHACLEFRR